MSGSSSSTVSAVCTTSTVSPEPATVAARLASSTWTGIRFMKPNLACGAQRRKRRPLQRNTTRDYVRTCGGGTARTPSTLRQMVGCGIPAPRQSRVRGSAASGWPPGCSGGQLVLEVVDAGRVDARLRGVDLVDDPAGADRIGDELAAGRQQGRDRVAQQGIDAATALVPALSAGRSDGSPSRAPKPPSRAASATSTW